jgi:cyclic pyranopterin phosphate synthase
VTNTTTPALTDGFGRELRYLRFSLTEACNMACTYCLPEGYPEWYRHKALLNRSAVLTLLSGFRLAGFNKVRFTGGEPTLHPNCLEAVKTARDLGFEQICLTTNGLSRIAPSLWTEAGLTHVNVSLDSLDPDTFQRMTKSKEHARVVDFILGCIAAGMTVKINAVLLRSRNRNEAKAMMQWALERRVTLRFIELMPTGLNNGFDVNERVLSTELHDEAYELGFAPQAKDPLRKRLAGPEQTWVHETLPGRIGFISPLSCTFCGDCNRLRVTAKGELKMCLFSSENQQIPLDDPAAVVAFLAAAIQTKPERHHLEQRKWGNVATFRTIGG